VERPDFLVPISANRQTSATKAALRFGKLASRNLENGKAAFGRTIMGLAQNLLV
jgi:hypothetical protein